VQDLAGPSRELRLPKRLRSKAYPLFAPHSPAQTTANRLMSMYLIYNRDSRATVGCRVRRTWPQRQADGQDRWFCGG